MPRAATENEQTDDATTASPEFGDQDVVKIFDLPVVRARMEAIAEEAAKLAVQKTIAAMNPSRAPLTMQANVADRFITESNAPTGTSSPHLKHYRCEKLKSDKIVEYDMKKLLSYLNGEKEIPETKSGRPQSARSLSMIQGSWISFLNGHCYAYTQNQVEQLEWMRTQPIELGGLPTMYEDPGGELFVCKLCQGLEPFGSRQGWSLHMHHVHNVITDLEPGVAPPTFANTSPDPFVGSS